MTCRGKWLAVPRCCKHEHARRLYIHNDALAPASVASLIKSAGMGSSSIGRQPMSMAKATQPIELPNRCCGGTASG
jgi:hypothetical protein